MTSEQNPIDQGDTINLTQKASKSVFWTFCSAVTVSGIRFLNTVILARILSPHDFGITGMAVLVTGVVTLFGQLGMGPALIQRKNVDEEFLSTGFWASVGVGVALALASSAAAPFAAMFFKEPALTLVIIVLASNFIFSSFAAIQTTMLAKELNFKLTAQVEILCNFFRVAIAFTLAVMGFSFWSIVIAMVAERIIKTLVFLKVVPWRPKWIFNVEKFKTLFRFGRNIYGQSFVSFLNGNMDNLITGRFLGAANLACYQFAYNLPHLTLTHIVSNVDEVLFPLYCKVQDDKERIRRGYLKTVKFISLLTFPLMFGLCFVADDFVRLAYGDKWLAAILPLKILCVSGALRSVFASSVSLLRAIGRPDLGFKFSLAVLPVTITAIIFFSRWGIAGVAAAMTGMALFALILVAMGLRFISTPWRDYLCSLLPAALCATLMILALWGLSVALPVGIWPVWKRFLFNLVIGAAAYGIFLYCLYRVDLMELVDFGKRMFAKS